MPIDDLCSQESCTVQLANFRTGASAGARETYGDNGSDLMWIKNKDVSSASWSFSPMDVGSTLKITDGTSWTLGSYTIASVNDGVATLNSIPASGFPGLGTWQLNPVATQNCLMQQLDGREALQYSARGMNVTHRAFFWSDVGLTNRHRVTWNGLYLRVHAYYRRARPGEDLLWVAELELITTRLESATDN